MYNIIIADTKKRWKKLEYKDILPIYYISDYGDIYNMEKNRYVNHLQYKDNGYVYVSLKTTSSNKTFSLHVLVAYSFVPGYNPDTGKIVVNHKDSSRSYNYYKNLEWTTYWENTIHGIKNGFIEGTVLKNGDKLIYNKEFIESICEYLQSGYRSKDIITALCIDDIRAQKSVKSLIKDLKCHRTHKDITSSYNIQHVKRNLFPIDKVHDICKLMEQKLTDDEIIKNLKILNKDEIVRYRQVIFNIRHRYSFIKISSMYNIPDVEYQIDRQSIEIKRKICELLQDGYSINEITDKLYSGDKPKSFKSLIKDIRDRRSNTKISKDYKW